jgi:cytochrome c biogenesis protein CcmG, thiol:disulfide interchange protein DsbE
MKKIKFMLFFGALAIFGCAFFCFTTDAAKPFPSFKLATISGDSVSQKDLIGKITVVNIWGTWCAPCVEEMPQLNSLCDKYKQDKNVVFLAVTAENKDKITKFLSKKTFNYTHLLDGKPLISQLQGKFFNVYPLHFVINQKGEIVSKKSGSDDKIGDFLSTAIEKCKAK